MFKCIIENLFLGNFAVINSAGGIVFRSYTVAEEFICVKMFTWNLVYEALDAKAWHIS